MSTETDGFTSSNTTTTYEYRTVLAPSERVALTRDTYESFGWVEDGTPSSDSPLGSAALNLKRDRHIKNRSIINELQRRSEAALTDIDRLERSKTQKAQIVAFTIGIIGCAFLAGSVFSMLASLWVPFVLLGIVGLIGWALPYFSYKSIRDSQTSKIAPLIEQRYDTIYDASEQAQRLMAQQ
ncbi:MAG: hypothetical protein LKI24_10315 [Acidipropionibacterium sp.]|jgi:hypothetical protein|nr:hypothetical protein [Acidipropionibacterium sp.]